MNITATHINYLLLCKRKLWLFNAGVQMEHTSDLVAAGNLIGETTYNQRAQKYTEIELQCTIGGVSLHTKIDFYDAKNRVVHEIKKSNKLEQVHVAQVKVYLYMLYQKGITDATAVIEYPKLRETQTIAALSPEDIAEVELWIAETIAIVDLEQCPELVKKPYCKSCAYNDFCFINESSI